MPFTRANPVVHGHLAVKQIGRLSPWSRQLRPDSETPADSRRTIVGLIKRERTCISLVSRYLRFEGPGATTSCGTAQNARPALEPAGEGNPSRGNILVDLIAMSLRDHAVCLANHRCWLATSGGIMCIGQGSAETLFVFRRSSGKSENSKCTTTATIRGSLP